MSLCSCGQPIAEGRSKLGMRTCLTCGEVYASKETAAKKAGIQQAYSKGPYQYMPSTLSKDTRDQRRVLSVAQTDMSYSRITRIPKPRRKAIGMLWLTVEDRVVNQSALFYDTTDARIQKAARVVYF